MFSRPIVDTRQLLQPSVNLREPISTLRRLSLLFSVPNSAPPKSSRSLSKASTSSAIPKKPASSPMLMRPKGSASPTRNASSPLLLLMLTSFNRWRAEALNTRRRMSTYRSSTRPPKPIRGVKRPLKMLLPLASKICALSAIRSVSQLLICTSLFRKSARKFTTSRMSDSSPDTVLPTNTHSGFSMLKSASAERCVLHSQSCW